MDIHPLPDVINVDVCIESSPDLLKLLIEQVFLGNRQNPSQNDGKEHILESEEHLASEKS